jgi:hypothetical protein
MLANNLVLISERFSYTFVCRLQNTQSIRLFPLYFPSVTLLCAVTLLSCSKKDTYFLHVACFLNDDYQVINVPIMYVSLCVLCCISLCFLFQESVLRISEIFNLSAKSSVKGRSNPTCQRNICVVLGCIAEKLAGPSRISILTPGTLNYLIANLVSLLYILCNVHGLYYFYYFQPIQ